jgi:hypothetical protein
MKYKFVALAAILSVASLCRVEAAESGNTQYGPGASQFYAGAFPPIPGFYFLSQTSYYYADRMNDSNGNKLPIDLKVRTAVETMRVLYVSPWDFAGGQIVGQFVVPVLNIDLDIANQSAHETNFADFTGTLGVSWHLDQKNSIVLGMDMGMPTGHYNVNNSANAGVNHWSFQPTIGYHYSDPEGLEIGTTARLIFNTKNNATDYTSGTQFVWDYAVGWNIKQWRVGAVGYYMDQLTDDRGPTAPADGHRTKAFAIGPSVSYSFTPALQISASWQKEIMAENHTEGDTVWFNVATKF